MGLASLKTIAFIKESGHEEKRIGIANPAIMSDAREVSSGRDITGFQLQWRARRMGRLSGRSGNGHL